MPVCWFLLIFSASTASNLINPSLLINKEQVSSQHIDKTVTILTCIKHNLPTWDEPVI